MHIPIEINMQAPRAAGAPSSAVASDGRARPVRGAQVPVPYNSYERMRNVSARTKAKSAYARQRGRERHVRTIRRSGAARPSRRGRRFPTLARTRCGRGTLGCCSLGRRAGARRVGAFDERGRERLGGDREPAHRPAAVNPAHELVEKTVQLARLRVPAGDQGVEGFHRDSPQPNLVSTMLRLSQPENDPASATRACVRGRACGQRGDISGGDVGAWAAARARTNAHERGHGRPDGRAPVSTAR